jgi:3-oxoacyl-[acyl-carrier protein] reductase
VRNLVASLGAVTAEERKVAIVTGAARGLGARIAARLGANGWAVVLADRDGDGSRSVAERLAATGIAARGVELDVADSAAAAALVEGVLTIEGGLDGLVNNAGVLADAPLVEMSDEQFFRVLEVCLFGAFYMARAAAPPMIEAAFGRIVNMSSRAYMGNPGQANYSAAKAGLVGLTKSMAKELGRHSITVNAIAPGMVETEMVLSHPKAEDIIARAALANSVPRVGTTDDIAAAVSYLFSDDAGYITGDVLHVSGGRFG